MFYIGSEDVTKRRCVEENKRSDPKTPEDRLAEWREAMRKRRLEHTGSEDIHAGIEEN